MTTTRRLQSGRFFALAAGLVSIFHTNCRAESIYVSYGGGSTSSIGKFTIDGTGSDLKTDAAIQSYGLAFNRNGDLYAANYYMSTIEKYTLDGVGSSFDSNGLSGPYGLTVDWAGNVYAGNQDTNNIVKITPAGVPSVFASAGVSLPFGLAFDSAGDLYVANAGNNKIVRITSDGVGSVFATYTGSYYLAGLTFGRDGTLYASTYLGDTVEAFTRDGVESTFATIPGGHPLGLTFDTAGNLYVADVNYHRIDRIAPNGDREVFVSTGSNVPYFLANPTYVIPEPSSILMVIVGIVSLIAWSCSRPVIQ